MEGTNFWLVYIQEDLVTVALVNQSGSQYHTIALGPSRGWDINNEQNFITAVDESLSSAALNAHITEDQEPFRAAFVVPPFWVDDDGKISASKIKFIKSLCKELQLNPSGFLSEDEAIVEEANQKDDFPASFILVHLDNYGFYLSLVYLGHIKERIRKKLDQPFNGQILESTILELNSQSALPPQIILFGTDAENHSQSIKDFPWVGKKDVETFLHFPEVKVYQQADIVNIFAKIITAQIENPLVRDESISSEETNVEEDENENVTPEIREGLLEEVEADGFGFSTETEMTNEDKLNIINNVELPKEELLSIPIVENIIPPKESKDHLSFIKNIKLPKINFQKFKFNNLIWIGLILLSILSFTALFLSKTTVTLFLTPYSFEKKIPVTLLVDGKIDDLSKSIIPVDKESFDVKASSKITTTGQKTVGDKAKGEIIIYNKSNKSQSVPNGTILIDSSGKKFELTTSVSIASSSSNLDEGVIKLGQTKTAIIATSIGSEYNISGNSQLTFEKVSDSILIAKVVSALSGGSKEQIQAVSSQDKTNAESQIDDDITKKTEEKTNSLSDIQGVIIGTTKVSKGKTELSREVGEQADELTASVDASVSVFTITDGNKEKVIKQFLSSEDNFNQSNLDIDKFKLEFSGNKIESQQALGTLTISGLTTPNVDLKNLKKSLLGKTTSKASEIIKKTITRAYNFTIKNNLPLNLLPFRVSNLSIEIESKNL